jgi:hypothetical protein
MAVGEQLLRELIFIHMRRASDKFGLLILMLRKLYALVRPPTLTAQPCCGCMAACAIRGWMLRPAIATTLPREPL